ncbi:MAG: UDP-N-acetylglucosamine--N-acetylmuramyl-(pentapeptide) pyrophosphoryl-undecaprenol N-acetylglucosamine transferase, partial [Deltaproteobacteria bacterium]
SKAEALEFFKFNKDKFTVLVMGGSQGSHRINVEFTDALSGLRDISNLQVIHITGLEDYSSLKEKYRFMGARVQVFGFFSRMHYAYSACDLIISRAGAATVSEIIFFGLPALIIPYPHAYAHQSANAAILAEKLCASVIKDEELNAQLLKNRIEDFMAHPEKLQDMRSAYLGFAFNDPAGALADEVAALVSEGR